MDSETLKQIKYEQSEDKNNLAQWRILQKQKEQLELDEIEAIKKLELSIAAADTLLRIKGKGQD